MATRFQQLNQRVVLWAVAKGILSKSTPMHQALKTQEELDELKQSLTAQANGLDKFINAKGELVDTKSQIKDDFGDLQVTIINGCKMQGLDPLDCLEHALNIIEKRKGKMVDGQFVKDEK